MIDINIVAGVVGVFLAIAGGVWRIALLIRSQERDQSARMKPIYEALEQIRERLRLVEYKVDNDVTGRRKVAEMLDRVTSLEAAHRETDAVERMAKAVERGLAGAHPLGERRSA